MISRAFFYITMIERLKYKGHDILRLIDDVNQRRSIQFGVDKAKLLAAHTKEIAEFIADVDKGQAPEPSDGGNTDEQAG